VELLFFFFDKLRTKCAAKNRVFVFVLNYIDFRITSDEPHCHMKLLCSYKKNDRMTKIQN
jgi:hypothetical protein